VTQEKIGGDVPREAQRIRREGSPEPPNPPSFLVHRGNAKLVISVPHAGTFIPDNIKQNLTPIGQKAIDTDWHVDKLYDFAKTLDVTLLIATHSRTVVDLNRAPSNTPLYPGQAETTICPTETFDGEPLYATAPPTPADIAERVKTYWQPYHDTLAAELARIKTLHGSARLLDGHSIRQSIPRLFEGKLPDLNFGTNSGRSADKTLVDRALDATADSPFSQVLDGRFRGGHITRHYGRPAENIQAIQLELAQTTYMDEAEPHRFSPGRAENLVATLAKLVAALLHA
jgi:N-formylglutamate deformylase